MLKSDVGSLPEGEVKESFKEGLSNIEESLSYINKIVLDLQDFAKPPKPILEEIAVEKIVQEVLSTTDIPKTVLVTVLLGDGSLALKIDRTYMKRILANLMVSLTAETTKWGCLIG